MRQSRPSFRRWTCHWSHVTRRGPDGRPIRTPVWICEYPYRTMLSQPCTDCEGHDAGPEADSRRLQAMIGEVFFTH